MKSTREQIHRTLFTFSNVNNKMKASCLFSVRLKFVMLTDQKEKLIRTIAMKMYINKKAQKSYVSVVGKSLKRLGDDQ